MNSPGEDFDDYYTRLFSETPDPWIDPAGAKKVLARTVHQPPRTVPVWSAFLRRWWTPAVAVIATVAIFVAVPALLGFLTPDDRDPARPVNVNVDLEAATAACRGVDPVVNGGDAGAGFVSTTYTANGESFPITSPFTGHVALAREPRFCLFAPVTRTADESRYAMTVVDPVRADLGPTSDNAVDGALYAGQREDKFVYLAVFRFPDVLKTKDYFDLERKKARVTGTSDSRMSASGVQVAGHYVTLEFWSDSALKAGERVGFQAVAGEALEWLPGAVLVTGEDAQPLPDAQSDIVDLRE